MGCGSAGKNKWAVHKRRMLYTKNERIGVMEKKFIEKWGLSRESTNFRVEVEWPSSQKMLDWKLKQLNMLYSSETLTKGQIHANLEKQREFKEARSQINLAIKELDYIFCM